MAHTINTMAQTINTINKPLIIKHHDANHKQHPPPPVLVYLHLHAVRSPPYVSSPPPCLDLSSSAAGGSPIFLRFLLALIYLHLSAVG